MISAHRISETTPSVAVRVQFPVLGARGGDNGLPQSVERARADIAVDDADAAERKRPQPGRGASVGVAANRHVAPNRSGCVVRHGT